MLKQEGPRRNVYQFDDLVDMVRYVSTEPRRWQSQDSRSGYGSDWTLGASYDDSLKLARDGWEEGVRNISALATGVPNQIVRTRELSVAGEFPDVPRYLAGDPFNMIKRGKQRVPKASMAIVASIGANCNVPGQEMANFGAALVALVDRLESRNVRVELYGVWRCQNMGDRSTFSCSWTIKRTEDHLDLSAVAFGLGHPAMLRRLGFAVMERSPRHTEVYSYGVASEVTGPIDMVNPPDNAMFIGGVGSSRQCSTLPGALAYAKASINRAYRTLGYSEDIAELEVEDE